MLLHRFLSRLWSKHVRGDRHPLAFAYLGGIALLLAGVTGLAAWAVSVVATPWTAVFATVVGVLSFVAGAVLDRAHNQSLTVRIPNEPESPVVADTDQITRP